MAEHTPRPWKAVQRKYGYPQHEGGPERRLWDVYDPSGRVVAMGTIYNVDEFDARLIAAAPDLYDAAENALEALIGCCVPAGGVDDRKAILEAQQMLRAAIAKATGDA